MNTYAKVAGLNICFSGFDLNSICFSSWRNFLTAQVSECSIVFNNKRNEKKVEFAEDSYLLSPMKFSRYQDRTAIGFVSNANLNGYSDVKMVANNDWSQFDVYDYSVDTCFEEIRLLTDAAFRSRIAYYCGFAAHASVVVLNDEAVIFAAQSGVGKSTHAELWKEYLHAEIINGDHAIIRVIDDNVYVFGAPWSGTSQYNKNLSASLKAIVILEQSSVNDIFYLTNSHAYMEFVSNCHLPTWDDNLVSMILSNIENVTNKINIYKLKCNTDPSAAFLARRTIYNL